MRKHLTTCLLSAGVILLATTGCQEDSDLGPGGALLNTHWRLYQVENFPITLSSYSYDSDSYIEFKADNSMSGLATCTGFSGKFTSTPAKQQLNLGTLNLGTPTCNSPSVAARYLAALPNIVRYEVSGGTLRLYNAQDSKPQLIFKAE